MLFLDLVDTGIGDCRQLIRRIGRAGILPEGALRAKEGDMPFVASNGLTEAGTSKTITAGGVSVHYHDIGSG
jgi:hypothetical protein